MKDAQVPHATCMGCWRVGLLGFACPECKQETFKTACLLAWHNACNSMHEGKRPDCPCAVHLGKDKKRTPVLELDEEGQVVKPDPCEPEGSAIGKRKR